MTEKLILKIFGMARVAVTIIFLIIWENLRVVEGLIGYDCSGSTLNLTSYSLLHVEECNVPFLDPNSTTINIELMQLNKYEHIEINECRVQIERTIHHCGMFSHVSIVQNYHREYFVELDQHECERLHHSNSLAVSHNIFIDNLVRNALNSRPITLAGRTSTTGSCKGTQYSDPFGTWDDVIVNALVRIFYTSYTSTIELQTNKVALNSGAKCDFLSGSCMDSTGTQAFWSVKPKKDCKFDEYTALYRGPATRIEATANEPPTYIVTTEDFTFSLEQRARVSTCGYILIQTEIPKLFIIESVIGTTFPTNRIIETENVDLIQYVNAKIVHIEYHIRKQIKKLYHHIRLNECETKRTTLMNSLALATLTPDMFAYNLMKGPGYHAIPTGEQVTIIKCTAVPIKIRKTDECTLEIPVSYNNESYFLNGISRMLIRKGTAIDCHSAIPTVFFLDENWYTLNPDLMKAPTPLILNPLKPIEWEYEKLQNLGTSGIYNEQDMEKLRDRLLTKAETPVVVSNMARAASGNQLPTGSISMRHLLDREMLEEITESAVQKAWNSLKIFGNTVSIVIGIITIIQIIIGLINLIIHGFTLHDAFGWSLQLAGACCVSITHLLLYKPRRENINIQQDNEPMYTAMKSFRKIPDSEPPVSVVINEPTTSKEAVIDHELLSKARNTLRNL
ncbi:uncharacterized protein LOC135168981 [Diachasmimorpha longicaudata]|uniref:uncharacterized protein LOC135168981 n=1 Tax=Diachasmimorpha longicaudata TaxID=58733 RepID=UPI0030B8D0AB